MKCPACGARTGVTHTRDLGEVVIRRRLCPECGYVMKTAERYDWLEIFEGLQRFVLKAVKEGVEK